MKHFLLACSVVLAMQSLPAQVFVSARIGAGMFAGRAHYENSGNSLATVDTKNQPGILINAGLHNQYLFGGSTGIGLDLMYNYGLCKDKVQTTYTGAFPGSTDHELKRYFSTFSLPLYFQYRFGKIHVNLGGQLNYYLKTQGKERTDAVFSNVPTSSSQDIEPLPIKRLDLGIYGGWDVYLDRSIYLYASGYWGLSELNDQESSLKSFKTLQVALGVGVRLWGEQANTQHGHSSHRRR